MMNPRLRAQKGVAKEYMSPILRKRGEKKKSGGPSSVDEYRFATVGGKKR